MSCATASRNAESCDTIIDEISLPERSCTYLVSQATPWTSTWLVGSSSRSTCGRTVEIAAKATRAFWPPDRSLILRSWAEEGSPFSPSSCRTCW
mmetsp:Transcript_14517/g.46915  ORF Transcript_14517/g.46915 Transcript_14517/m.46915 type:complete len:94 (+) Transcript_14517:1748-2029(+)